MVIFYYGADHPFEQLEQTGYKRRNTIILKTLAAHKDIYKVISFNYTDRKTFLKHFIENLFHKRGKIVDVYFTEIFTLGKLKIHFLNRLFNRVYFSLLLLQYSKHRIFGWVYWPNGFIDYKRAGIRPRFVFDADHSLLDDPNLESHDRVDLEKLLYEVSGQATTVLSASNMMLDWFRENGARSVYRLRNGIDLSRFNSARPEKLDKFSIVYCGILSNWIDYELFIKVAETNPSVDFVIIGREFMNDTYNKLKQYKNVFLWGEKSVEEVSALLPKFHAGLGLYKKGVIDGDSMKLYEYLAAGLPVICTNYHENLQQDFNGVLFIGDSPEYFSRTIRDIKESRLMPARDRVELLLKESTWSKRVDGAVEFIC